MLITEADDLPENHVSYCNGLFVDWISNPSLHLR